ncbi:MAG: DUF3343 domain-containing protein [Chloroflexota bacterium]
MLASGDRLITFDSTHHALRAETLLEAAGIAIMIIPTPRELSASCGLAITFRSSDASRLQAVLRDSGIQISGRYRVTGGEAGSERRYEREGETT